MQKQVIQIINIIQSNRGRKVILELSPELRLRDGIGFDSLDLAELTVRIENEFGIDIFEDGIVETIGEILEKLEKK